MGDMQEKPPIGLMPKKIHDEKRAAEIVLAMSRFLEGNMAIPREWVAELLEFYDRYHLITIPIGE